MEDKISAVEICEVSSPEEDKLPTYTMLNMLQPHILVNSIGDYYDVPGLKKQANEHIRDILESSWSASDIIATAELASASTSDTELHAIITTAINGHIKELLDREDFLGQGLLNSYSIGIIQELHKKLVSSEREVKELEKKIVDLEQSSEVEEDWYKRKISCLESNVEKLKGAIGISNSKNSCRHCGREWHSYIDRSTYKVRCGRCGTRHEKEYR